MAEEYERQCFIHDFQKKELLEAMEIVRKYIINNKRILVGGMSMDLSLRSKKSYLYETDKIPDYDCYSPEFHLDAYKIGDMITQLGITGVSVIRGTHVSTMRVRVNFVPVADITYVPLTIYEKIPIIRYHGFLLCHPHYQMIDQHRALSLPFENPPMEVIASRWKKDMERYDVLTDIFPVKLEKNRFIYFNSDDNESVDSSNDETDTNYTTSTEDELEKLMGELSVAGGGKTSEEGLSEESSREESSRDASSREESSREESSREESQPEENRVLLNKDNLNILNNSNEVTQNDVDINILENNCLGGYTAFLYWVNKAKNDGWNDKEIISLYEIDITKVSIRYKSDSLIPITIISDNFLTCAKNYSNSKNVEIKYFNSLLDKIPRYASVGNVHFVDNKGRLLSCYYDETYKIHVSGLQDVMCFLLSYWVIFKNFHAKKSYIAARKLLVWACEQYAENEKEIFKKYLPLVSTYGAYNWSESFIVSREDMLVQMKETRKELSTPKNYYPTINKVIQNNFLEFDPTLSPLYQNDAKEVKILHEKKLPI